MLLITAQDISSHKIIGNGVRYIPTHKKVTKVNKLSKYRYTKALYITMELKLQQQQAKCRLFNLLQNTNNISTKYYRVYGDYHHSVYMLSILPNGNIYATSSIYISSVNINSSVFNLDLDHPSKHFIKINNDRSNYVDQTFSIIFYCDNKGKVVRPALYFQENIHNFREKWAYAHIYGKAAAYNITSIDFYHYEIEHLYQDAKLPKYQAWNEPGYTNNLFNSKDHLFDHLFAHSESQVIVKVNIDNPVQYKQYYADRVQIYQCGQGQSTMHYAAVDVDNSTAEVNDDLSLTYQDDQVKFNVLPTGEIAMLVSNSTDEQFSMLGYKYAQSVKNPKQKVIIKLGIYKNAKVATTCESNAKIRANYCKVLQINKIHFVDNNWLYGKKTRRAQSCVYNSTNNFVYTVGEDITITDFDPDLKEVCRPGIHYFTTPELALRYYSEHKEFKYLITDSKSFKPKSKTTDQITKSEQYIKFRTEQQLDNNLNLRGNMLKVHMDYNIDISSDNFLDLDQTINRHNRSDNFINYANRRAELRNRKKTNDGVQVYHASKNIDELDLASSTSHYKSKLSLKDKRKLD